MGMTGIGNLREMPEREASGQHGASGLLPGLAKFSTQFG
jgi:hypothetical protein